MFSLLKNLKVMVLIDLFFIFMPTDTKDMLRKLLDEIVSLEVYFSLCYRDFMLLSF